MRDGQSSAERQADRSPESGSPGSHFISVVAPIYNEVDNLSTFLKRMHRVFGSPGLAHETGVV